MTKNNIVQFPKNTTTPAKEVFFNNRTIENFLNWFSSCIDLKEFNQGLVESAKALKITQNKEVEQVKYFFFENVPKFHGKIKIHVQKKHYTEASEENGLNAEKSQAARDLEDAICHNMAVSIKLSDESTKAGFNEVFDPYLVKNSMAWPVDSGESSYSKNPLFMINEFIGIHYPQNSIHETGANKLSSGKILQTIDYAMAVFEILSSKALEHLTRSKGMESQEEKTAKFISSFASEPLLLAIKGWSRVHRKDPYQDESPITPELSLIGWCELWRGSKQAIAKEHRDKEKLVALSISADMFELFETHRKIIEIAKDSVIKTFNPEDDVFVDSMINMLTNNSRGWIAESIFDLGVDACCMSVGVIDLNPQQISVISAWIERCNQNSMREGFPKALPISCCASSDWFGILLYGYNPYEDNLDLHFDLLLGYILSGYSFCWDGDDPEWSSYYDNCIYAVIIGKCIDECSEDLAEALVLAQLHLNFFESGTLEPWPKVGKSIQNTLNAGTDAYNRFVFELAQESKKVLLENKDRPILSYRLNLIMRMCRTPKIKHQALPLIRNQLKEVAPISKAEAKNIIHEKLGSVFLKLAEGTRSILIDSEYLYRRHQFSLTDEKLSTWNSILTMPFQAIEHQMGEGWKASQSNQPPELGTMLYAVDFIIQGKISVDSRQKEAMKRGIILLQIYPKLKDKGSLVRKLKRAVSKYRNPASHGDLITSEKLKRSREDLFQEDILREFLSLLTIKI